jgi:ribose 5-phosphate isomerase A
VQNSLLSLEVNRKSYKLGGKYKRRIPIEFIPMPYCPMLQETEAMYGGMAELQMGKFKAGPLVTDNGNFISGLKFPALDFD